MMSTFATLRIDRSWNENLFRTTAFTPMRSATALLTWEMDPPRLDAGVPAAIIDIVSQVAVSLGPVAFRLFWPHDLPAELSTLTAPRAWLLMRLYQRLTRTWPADIAVANDAQGTAELFKQGWPLQGQTALVLRAARPSETTIGTLRSLRDWHGVCFPSDARLLIAPAVDGDGILLAAASEDELADVLAGIRQAVRKLGMTLNGDASATRDRPAMNVAISHHIDASEPDEKGFHDYHYEYDIYRFSRADRTYVARSYVEEPDRAAFLSRLQGDESHLLSAADLTHPLLLEAVDYLRTAGKTTIERLSESEGYVPLEIAKPQGGN